MVDVDADELDDAIVKAIKIRQCDMEHALSKTHPSSLRDKVELYHHYHHHHLFTLNPYKSDNK